MAIAVVQAQGATGAGPTLANAEDAGGIGFGLADSENAGGSPITKPTAAGTNYSWIKWLALMVTSGGGASNISDRKVRWATAPTTGFYGFFRDGTGTYAQATSGTKPTDDVASNGAVPAGYTLLSTTFQTWHAASAAAVNSTRNGNYLNVVAGVGNNYAGSAAAAAALPNLELQYLESV